MPNPSLIASTDSQRSAERRPISPIFSSTKIVTVRVYKRRLWMLFVFSFLSLLCGMLFSLYPSVANVTICYYNVSENSVNWTSLLHMVIYIVFVFPVTWLINYAGLRKAVLLAAVINTLSCAIQFATLRPDAFAYVMVSMFFASISNTIVLGLPPFVASTWFPRQELSRACAVGVSGNMLGIAVGFVYSPLLMSDDCSNIPLITDGKRNIAYSLTGINVFVLLLLLISFQNAPEYPPSTAEAHRLGTVQEPYKSVILRLICNWDFFLISMVYGK
ncbi:Feline leukemia virus subgroup C like protein [Argiope bruennichi]|uniref:Feline leukemia virus subgroup C like protein n=1 Tax=Argiope bruennichi TaxID=94029 RepID=A0A8T0DZG8_ARGBR|nr:Feline leukemia virus subgroup C like protein [Argiope bruennichi]